MKMNETTEELFIIDNKGNMIQLKNSQNSVHELLLADWDRIAINRLTSFNINWNEDIRNSDHSKIRAFRENEDEWLQNVKITDKPY